MQWPIIPIKNLTSLFPLIFLSKHICVYALGRIKWILGIIWPWNQHFNLKNQRNWKKTSLNVKYFDWELHWWKKLTLIGGTPCILTTLQTSNDHCVTLCHYLGTFHKTVLNFDIIFTTSLLKHRCISEDHFTWEV